MQNTLGATLLGPGDSGRATVLFEKARATRSAKLGPDRPDTLMSMNNLAEAYHEAGKGLLDSDTVPISMNESVHEFNKLDPKQVSETQAFSAIAKKRPNCGNRRPWPSIGSLKLVDSRTNRDRRSQPEESILTPIN